MTTKQIQTRRLRLFDEQAGRCHCCERHMWEPQRETLETFVRRMNAEGLTPRRRTVREKLRCTFEHFHSAAQGGGIHDGYDVANCWECNNRRGDAPYPMWRDLVRSLGSAEAAYAKLRGMAA